MICWLLTNLYVSWEKREMKTYLLHTVSRKNILKCKILSLHALARLHKRSISTGSLAFSRQKGSVSHFCQCALETWHFIQSLNHQWKCMCVTSKHKQGGLPYTMACKMLPFTETVSWKPLNMIYCMTKPQTTLQRVLKIIRTFHWIISLHATKPETFSFFLLQWEYLFRRVIYHCKLPHPLETAPKVHSGQDTVIMFPSPQANTCQISWSTV